MTAVEAPREVSDLEGAEVPPRRAELVSILKLAVPMMGAQGGLMLMGVVDTLFVGRVSSLELSAVALGNSIASLIVVLGVGLVMGIEPLVAQAAGAGASERARQWMWQGLYVGALISLPLVALTAGATFLIEPLGVAPDIARRSAAFLWARVPGIFANCFFAVFRAYLSALGRPRPILIAVFAANLLNFVLDWLFVFGRFGLPALGGVGAGLATSVSWTFMAALSAFAASRVDVSPTQDGRALRAFRREDAALVVRLGLPIGLQIVAEVGIFSFTSTMVARFGEVQLAGHQVAITLASLSFMCALGIANASTARVGQWVGAGRSDRARRTGLLGIVLGAAFMGAAGLAFAVFRGPLAALFSPTDAAARAVGEQLLLLAALFSVFDGVQVVGAGVLRGAGDTRWPFIANVVAHWLVALPVALYLGQVRGLGAQGYWLGMTVGLAGVAIILVTRFLSLSSRPIARVEV